MKKLSDISVKIFADGAEKASMLELYRGPLIKGFTTNPTLMRKAGIRDYREFSGELLRAIRDHPICFEVFSEDFDEMAAQALEIASWGENVYVKIPVTNSSGASAGELVRRLTNQGVKLNVTALFTLEQVRHIGDCLAGGAPSIVSVFAGRIADTGRDPIPLMAEAVDLLRSNENAELLWASPREILNIFHADSIGCHIITITSDLLEKLPLIGKDLSEYSLETVKMFHGDAAAAGYEIHPSQSGKAASASIQTG